MTPLTVTSSHGTHRLRNSTDACTGWIQSGGSHPCDPNAHFLYCMGVGERSTRRTTLSPMITLDVLRWRHNELMSSSKLAPATLETCTVDACIKSWILAAHSTSKRLKLRFHSHYWVLPYRRLHSGHRWGFTASLCAKPACSFGSAPFV